MHHGGGAFPKLIRHPEKVGTQEAVVLGMFWIPAFAGMTVRGERQGQDRCRSWPSRARGRNAPGAVSRPCQSARLSDRRYATDRDLTREMPLVVPRDQRNHFLPPVMTTGFPSGFGGRGFRLQPRHLEYRLCDLAILVNPHRELIRTRFAAGNVRIRICRILGLAGLSWLWRGWQQSCKS